MTAGKTARKEREGIRIEAAARVQRVGDRLIARLPDKASAGLPSRGQVAVRAEANGHAFDTVLEPDGMKGHWLNIDDRLRKTLGVEESDEISLELAPSAQWPEPEVPDDLRAALSDAPDISEMWNDITPMARWEWVRWIGATANPATRERRVEVTVSKMRSGKRRPCCFDLASCTDPELSKSGKLVAA